MPDNTRDATAERLRAPFELVAVRETMMREQLRHEHSTAD